MFMNDKLIADTAEKKNALEEFIYNYRSQVEGELGEYLVPAQRQQFLDNCRQTEDWLYQDGADSTKAVYTSKLAELQKIVQPALDLQKEAEERPRAAEALMMVVKQYLDQATSNDERFEHIPADEKKKVADECLAKQHWLETELAKAQGLKKSEKPAISSAQIKKERESLVMFCSKIMSKPKPQPKKEESPKPTAMETDSAASDKDSSAPAPMETEETRAPLEQGAKPMETEVD